MAKSTPQHISPATAINGAPTGGPVGSEGKGPKTKKKSSKSRRRSNLIAVLCVLLGIAIMTYPVVATLIMNRSQQEAVEAIHKKVTQKYTVSEREKMLAETERYNVRLKDGPILDPFLARVAPDTPQYKYYLSLLDFGDSIMGSIKIPKIKVDLPIYHGTYDYALNRGVGHLFGSSMPVGGINTHSVLTAHSGLGTATMFDNLPKLKKGDAIYLMVAGRTLKYKMVGSDVVVPTDTKTLGIYPGKDMVTLVTCTPYGINTHRLLVHFERAPLEKKEAAKIVEQQYEIWQNWMWIPIIFGAAALVIIFFPARRSEKDIEKKAMKAANKARKQATKQGKSAEECEALAQAAYDAVMVKYAPKLEKIRARKQAKLEKASKRTMRKGVTPAQADSAAANVAGEAGAAVAADSVAGSFAPAPSAPQSDLPQTQGFTATADNDVLADGAISAGAGASAVLPSSGLPSRRSRKHQAPEPTTESPANVENDDSAAGEAASNNNRGRGDGFKSNRGITPDE